MIDMYLLMEKVSNPVKCSLLTLDVNGGATAGLSFTGYFGHVKHFFFFSPSFLYTAHRLINSISLFLHYFRTLICNTCTAEPPYN